MNYKKRIPDNTFYAYDVTTHEFKVISDTANDTKIMNVLTGSAADLNIITFNTQVNASPTLYEDITAQQFSDRRTAMLAYLQNN